MLYSWYLEFLRFCAFIDGPEGKPDGMTLVFLSFTVGMFVLFAFNRGKGRIRKALRNDKGEIGIDLKEGTQWYFWGQKTVNKRGWPIHIVLLSPLVELRRDSLMVAEYVFIDEEKFPPGTIFEVRDKQLAVKERLDDRRSLLRKAGF